MKNILEYQKIDNEVLTLQKELENSTHQEQLNKMRNAYKSVQDKLVELEEKSQNLYKQYEEESEKYKKAIKQSGVLTKLNLDDIKENDLKTNLDTANKISSDLFMIERKMNILLLDITNTLKEFELFKKQGLFARSKFNESKTLIENEKEKIQPKIDKLILKMKTMEKGLDENLYTKYKSLKHDNIFPVYVPLNDIRCGYCRVEIPSFKLDKLKNDKFIVCEQCRRVIYTA